MKKQEASPFKGFVAGFVGGVVGTLALDLFQQATLAATRKAADSTNIDDKYTRQQEQQLQGFNKAHADAYQAITQTDLSAAERKVAAPLTHYAFGALCGGFYGLLTEYVPQVSSGFGTAFGSALFLAAQEGAVPALGLSPTPDKIPGVLHAVGFTAHNVYGASVEGTRLLVRRAL